MHRVHTQGTQAARTLHSGHAHAAPRPCASCALGAMSWPPSGRVAARTSHVAGCVAGCAARRVELCVAACPRSLLHRIVGCGRRISSVSRHKASFPLAIQKLYLDTSHAAHALGRVASIVRCVARAGPYRGAPAARCAASQALCHDTILLYRD